LRWTSSAACSSRRPGAAWAWRERCWRSRRSAPRVPGPFRARQAGQPGRGEAGSQDPRAQGYITLLCTERALQGSCAPAHFAGAPRSNARVPADQRRATDDNGPIIGRSDPSDTQGSGAHSRGTRRAECGDGHPLSEQTCIPRAGRDVRGPTCSRGSPEATDGAASGRPAKRRDGARASGRGSSSCAMAAPRAIQPGARRRGWRAGRRGRAGLAPRVTARGLAREPWRGVRAGATRAWHVVSSRHAACPRGQARRISVCRGRPGRYRSC
jgi:hypothetical protein